MVARNDDSLTKRICTPVPKRMAAVVVIAEVADISGQYQDIADCFQRIIFKPTAVLKKLQVEIGCILNFHIFESNFKGPTTGGETGGGILVS